METERLLINKIVPSDKRDYFFNISHDRRVLETFICKYADTLDGFDFEPYLCAKDMFAVRLKETGRLIGIILYFNVKGDSCEIGYGIGSQYWNKGYMTEAVRRFLHYCLYEKGFGKVYASYFPENIASRRVMEKCGMKYDRYSEKELTYLGKERDLVYYAIEREQKS